MATINVTNVTTPINRITRENMTVLIRNNILDDSVEFTSDNDMMDTNSPVRSKNLQPISKKLFHSPLQTAKEVPPTRHSEDRAQRTRKRKQNLIPDGNERFKKAYIQCEDGYSEGAGMRKKVLISLFHNKEYSMDVGV